MGEAFFTGVPGPIRFGGLDSTDPLEFKVWHPDRLVLGKRMEEHLRFAVCFWHTFCWPGVDMFGGGTFERPWFDADADPMDAARAQDRGRVRVLREARRAVLLLPRPRRRARGRDARRDPTPTSTRSSTHAEAAQERTGVRLLWGTANLFSHPRYGAAPRPTPIPRCSPTPPRRSRTRSRSTHGSAARTTCCGAAARATTRCSTPTCAREARAARPLPAPGGRAQAQDRLRRHAPHRAQADGADQAPVRLRRRRRCTPSCAATASRASSSSTSR